MDFLVFFGFFGFFLDFFWFFGCFLDFGIFWNFLKFLGFFLFVIVTNVTTKFYHGYYWTPKMGQNSIKSSFFAQRAKKASTEGRSPPQELEVGPRSGPYLLVSPKQNIFQSFFRHEDLSISWSRFLDFLTIFDNFSIFLGFFYGFLNLFLIFWVFFGFFGFVLDFFLIFWMFFGFWDFLKCFEFFCFFCCCYCY